MKMNITDEKLIKLGTLIFIIWAYLLFSIGNKLILLSIPVLIITLLILIIGDKKTIKLNSAILLNYLFFVYLIFSLSVMILNNSDIYNSIRFCSYFFYGILFFAILSKNSKWGLMALDCFIVFSAMYAIFTLYAVFFPEPYLKIAHALFSEQQYTVISWLMRTNGYSGIAGQTANNAFMMSLGFAGLFCIIHYGEKRNVLLHYFLLITIVTAMFFTGKRSFLLINLLCIVFLISRDNFKKYFKNILSGIIAFFPIFIITSKINNISGLNIFERLFNTSGDISSGRFSLYKEAWIQFGNSPIIGNGIQSFKLLSNIRGPNNSILEVHNIYLQLLCETGIIGLLIFLFIIYINYQKVLISIKRTRDRFVNKSNMLLLNFSLYIQTLFIIYGLFGNPINDINMLFVYFMVAAIPYGLELNLCNIQIERVSYKAQLETRNTFDFLSSRGI